MKRTLLFPSVDLTVIIPFLNEAENIPFLLRSLSEYFENTKIGNVEVIFVDDGSSDNSVELLLNEKHVGYSAVVIKLSKNYGSHAALRSGIKMAKGKKICFVYADLQDPLEIINDMVEKQKQGFDIIFAEREVVTTGFFERIFSKFYALMMKKFVTPAFPENGFDTVLFNSKVANVLNNNVESNSSIFLQLLISGFKQEKIKYKKAERKRGTSKWTFSKKVKMFIDSFVAFSYFPIRLVSFVGFSFFSLGILGTIYIIIRKIIYADLTSGWPALISILMIGFGITNISLGIIAEYVWRTLDSARKRPVFIIEDIINL